MCYELLLLLLLIQLLYKCNCDLLYCRWNLFFWVRRGWRRKVPPRKFASQLRAHIPKRVRCYDRRTIFILYVVQIYIPSLFILSYLLLYLIREREWTSCCECARDWIDNKSIQKNRKFCTLNRLRLIDLRVSKRSINKTANVPQP